MRIIWAGITWSLILCAPICAQQRLVPPPQHAAIRPSVSHAGEVVQLQPPLGWHVWEVPVGREIRLVLTPVQRVERAAVRDGLWLAFHHPDVSDRRRPLEARLEARFRELDLGSADRSPVSPIQLHKANGLQTEFRVAKAEGALRGVHMLADTSWGTLEVLAISPVSSHQARKPDFQEILNSLRLSAPKRRLAAETTEPASAILGSWKAFRSRIQLYPGGKVEMVLDKAVNLTSAGGQSQGPERLEGSYRAENDLVFITWKDGSRLNFRWKLQGRALLLTDHRGETVSLRRLVH